MVYGGVRCGGCARAGWAAGEAWCVVVYGLCAACSGVWHCVQGQSGVACDIGGGGVPKYCSKNTTPHFILLSLPLTADSPHATCHMSLIRHATCHSSDMPHVTHQTTDSVITARGVVIPWKSTHVTEFQCMSCHWCIALDPHCELGSIGHLI